MNLVWALYFHAIRREKREGIYLPRDHGVVSNVVQSS